ncbi:MAG: HIT domain-containing protein [Acidilobus sp.]
MTDVQGGDAFCRISRGEERAHVAYGDDKVMIILDRSPICRAHMLVISRDHYESVDSAPPDVVSRAFVVAAAAARYLRERLKAPGVNIVTNSGAQAGQAVFHFHVHVIPRWEDCPPPVFSDEGTNISRVARRHRLTEDEAREVLSDLSGLPDFIKVYVGVSNG